MYAHANFRARRHMVFVTSQELQALRTTRDDLRSLTSARQELIDLGRRHLSTMYGCVEDLLTLHGAPIVLANGEIQLTYRDATPPEKWRFHLFRFPTAEALAGALDKLYRRHLRLFEGITAFHFLDVDSWCLSIFLRRDVPSGTADVVVAVLREFEGEIFATNMEELRRLRLEAFPARKLRRFIADHNRALPSDRLSSLW
jgi:hypothetical protein